MIQIYLYVYMYIDTYFQIILPDRLLQNTEYISLCYPIGPCWLSLAWKIPWTEEPGGLQSMGLLESDMTERLPFHFSPSCIGEGNGNPLQCSCLENPRDGGAWWAAVYGVAQSQTRLKRHSSSSSSLILKIIDLYTLKMWIVWHVNCITIKLLQKKNKMLLFPWRNQFNEINHLHLVYPLEE